MQKILVAIILNLSVGYSYKTQAQTTKIQAHQIVKLLATSEALVQSNLTTQLTILKAGWINSVTIDVVCHVNGITFLQKNTTFAAVIKKLKQQGINFLACENTLLEKLITKDQINADAHNTKMRIGYIVNIQEQRFSYIKAGN